MIAKIFKFIKKEKILVTFSVFLIVILLVVYWFASLERDHETGGTGGNEKNTVTILGWEKKDSNESDLGEVISQSQYEQLTKLVSQKLSQKNGDFDYKEAEIEDQINNIYDKSRGVDQTVFYLKITDSDERFKVILDHILNTASVSDGD